jgi:hypothetical protein
MHKIIIIFLLIILLYNLNNNEGFEDYSYKNSQRRIKSLFENNNENIEYKEIINKQNYNLNKQKFMYGKINKKFRIDNNKYELGGYEKINNNYICPKYLTYNGTRYQLWDNGKVVKIFNNYADYLKWFNFTKINYTRKNIFCEPLIPINRTMINGSLLDINKVYPRLFNIS